MNLVEFAKSIKGYGHRICIRDSGVYDKRSFKATGLNKGPVLSGEPGNPKDTADHLPQVPVFRSHL